MYNPKRHGPQARDNCKRRAADPRSGIRHSDIMGRRGPIAISSVDVQNRVATPSGWRIPYFSGDTFETYYEIICARNSSGKVKHETKDRCVRVLAGQLFVTIDGQVKSVLANQTCAFVHGFEYEYASPGDSDVEVLVCQGSEYEKDLIQITESGMTNKSTSLFADTSPLPPRVPTVRSEQTAARMREERVERDRLKGKRSPVPKKLSEVTPGTALAQTRPGGRDPFPGQQVVGVSPRPVGMGGFRDE
jgi:hypothetical protein